MISADHTRRRTINAWNFNPSYIFILVHSWHWSMIISVSKQFLPGSLYESNFVYKSNSNSHSRSNLCAKTFTSRWLENKRIKPKKKKKKKQKKRRTKKNNKKIKKQKKKIKKKIRHNNITWNKVSTRENNVERSAPTEEK